MSSVKGLQTWLFPACFIIFLNGCSWFDDSSEPRSSGASSGASSWSFSDSWVFNRELPADLKQDGSPLRLQGVCRFEPDLLAVLKRQQSKGVLLPLLKADKENTLAPDLENSAKLYKGLNPSLKLAGAGVSLQFYQILLTSIEYACPKHATREIDRCSMQGILSMGGLFSGDKERYDWGRIQKWLDDQDDFGYLIAATADLLNSDAMLHTRYSTHGRMLIRVNKYQRSQDINPYAGALRLDWVLPGFVQEQRFVSRGYCTLDWPSQEKLTPDQRQRIQNALLPDFIMFLKKAFKQLSVVHLSPR